MQEEKEDIEGRKAGADCAKGRVNARKTLMHRFTLPHALASPPASGW